MGEEEPYLDFLKDIPDIPVPLPKAPTKISSGVNDTDLPSVKEGIVREVKQGEKISYRDKIRMGKKEIQLGLLLCYSVMELQDNL